VAQVVEHLPGKSSWVQTPVQAKMKKPQKCIWEGQECEIKVWVRLQFLWRLREDPSLPLSWLLGLQQSLVSFAGCIRLGLSSHGCLPCKHLLFFVGRGMWGCTKVLNAQLWARVLPHEPRPPPPCALVYFPHRFSCFCPDQLWSLIIPPASPE
jgi:hypothetical protein